MGEQRHQKRYESYQLESIVNIEMHGGPINTKLEMPSTISVRRPDRMRIESRSQAGTVDIVSDGQHTWFYISATKKYIRRAASASPEAAVGNAGILPKNLPDVTKSVKSVKLTGEDTLMVGGEKMPCWMVQTVFDKIAVPEPGILILEGKSVSWIRKSDLLSLQNTFEAKLEMPGVSEPVNMTQSTQTTALRLNVALPDSLFVFTPPAGAKETEDWSLPGIVKPDVVGKSAPDFRGAALDGSQVSLSELRGKVVLLDFWATWCQPCRRDLPALQKLHQEFHDAGLVVLGITSGEDPAATRKFLSEMPLNYPIVPIDEGSELISKLSVSAFPTVVLIDREGKIASYEVGARGEAALRSDLLKLGIGQKP